MQSSGQPLLLSQTRTYCDHGIAVFAFPHFTLWTWTFACILALVGLYWTLQRPRGPRRLPILGSTIEAVATFEYHHDWTTQYATRFKTFDVPVLPRLRLIHSADPAVVEYFLKTNFNNYYKGPIVYAVNKELLGGGIFNSDGDNWRQQRKVASFEFSTRILRDFSTEAFRKYAVRLAKILMDEARTNTVVDMQDLLMRMTLDSICEVGFGVEIKSLSPTLPVVPFALAFDRSSANSVGRFFDYLWKLKRVLNIGSEARLKQDIALMDKFTYSVIDKRRRDMDENAGDITARRDLLSRFIALSKEDPGTYTNKMLRDVVLNFVIAGRDTTATTLSWFLYAVSQNPEVQLKILDELKAVLGDLDGQISCTASGVEKFARLLTYEALGKMHYLHSAISETLRLYPAVPEDSKMAIGDDVLPDGTRVRAGDVMIYLPYAMGRMEELWGSDAREFKPERWMKEGVFVPESPFKFTAFQAGPRICVGKESAYLQMKLTAALLVRFFEMKVEGEVRYAMALTLFIASGLRMRIKTRS